MYRCKGWAGIVYVGDKRNVVLKIYSQERMMGFDNVGREIAWLRKLEDFDRVPTIVEELPMLTGFIMTYMGERLTKENIPKDWFDQRDYLLDTLHNKYGVQHNDIKPTDILVKDGKLNLIDFGWSSPFGEPIPDNWPKGLGDVFRIPGGGFDDHHAFSTSIEYVLLDKPYHKGIERWQE